VKILLPKFSCEEDYMKQSITKAIWRGLPKKGLSRLMGKVARHPFSRHLIPLYIRHFDIDLAPVKKPLDQFEHLLDFFVRELHPEARPICGGKAQVVSPVDGTVSEGGTITEGRLIQAKGISYSLSQLLGGNEAAVKRFDGGQFVTIYLSPRDYHRIHMPIAGRVVSSTYIPGELYPVNEMGVRLVPGLFAVNERVITYIEGESGITALIKVGATNVGSIKVTYDQAIATNPKPSRPFAHKDYATPECLAKGAEVGRFEFGSTVILLFEPGQIEWSIPLAKGTSVRMGQEIARLVRLEEEASCSDTH
jgi:phosphatidylserine decarboxylase